MTVKDVTILENHPIDLQRVTSGLIVDETSGHKLQSNGSQETGNESVVT